MDLNSIARKVCANKIGGTEQEVDDTFLGQKCPFSVGHKSKVFGISTFCKNEVIAGT